jgi:crossover junction endodeoxyribonuclease RuvC
MIIMKILGIDPGLVHTGWGIVNKNQDSSVGYVSSGVIVTSKNNTFEKKLSDIYKEITNVIQTHQPDHIAIEEVFINMNPESSKKLIMARTSAFLACCNAGYQVNEYRPNTIKKNITGNGHASKSNISTMIKKILKIDFVNFSNYDLTDAIAIALCHAFAMNMRKYGN